LNFFALKGQHDRIGVLNNFPNQLIHLGPILDEETRVPFHDNMFARLEIDHLVRAGADDIGRIARMRF
jgi:hypothetical protein